MAVESADDQIKCEQLARDQWLAIRKKAALEIDPETCEVMWNYADIFDPYGVEPEKAVGQIGREEFARSPGSDIWVWFGDLSETVSDALWKKYGSRLAFPAGLFELPTPIGGKADAQE